MLLSREVREQVAKVFGVSTSGITEILDNAVVRDGRTLDDLAVITADKMSEYVGSVESFGRLWELTASKAYSELHAPVGIVDKPVDTVDNANLNKNESKKNK